jgi:hypothetical protein
MPLDCGGADGEFSVGLLSDYGLKTLEVTLPLRDEFQPCEPCYSEGMRSVRYTIHQGNGRTLEKIG